MNPTAKTEALEALHRVRDLLNKHNPLSQLDRRLLKTAVESATEQIEQIQELKRPRRGKAAVPAPENS